MSDPDKDRYWNGEQWVYPHEVKRLRTQEDRDSAFEAMKDRYWNGERWVWPDDIERCCNKGCSTKAAVVVGTRDQLWLCLQCAGLPKFKRHKKLGSIFPWRG